MRMIEHANSQDRGSSVLTDILEANRDTVQGAAKPACRGELGVERLGLGTRLAKQD